MVEKIDKLPKCAENVTNFAYAFYCHNKMYILQSYSIFTSATATYLCFIFAMVYLSLILDQ